jgi:hypothetical protein
VRHIVELIKPVVALEDSLTTGYLLFGPAGPVDAWSQLDADEDVAQGVLSALPGLSKIARKQERKVVMPMFAHGSPKAILVLLFGIPVAIVIVGMIVVFMWSWIDKRR